MHQYPVNNRYTAAGRRHLLDNAVQLILTAALEIVGAQETGRQDISAADREALQNAYDLILKNCPHQLSNADIIKKTNLNSFKLHKGFNALFNTTPAELFLKRRFMLARKYLKEGDSINSIALELE